MSSITSPVTDVAPDIASFGAGGQMYMASIWSGFNVKSGQVINPLFAFSANSSEENAAQLTNLMEARKVGSTMAFRANRLGIRFLWFAGSVPDLEALEQSKQLLASAVITLTVGSNETKVAEFSGLDLMQPIDAVAADATNTAAVTQGLGGGIGWIPLQVPIEIQANVNVGGTIRFTRSIGAKLLPASPTDPAVCGFVVTLQGLKVVKS